jgi:predicted polyphosphate/ATP-dependent NAD kinase
MRHGSGQDEVGITAMSEGDDRCLRLGLIVNPIAGMGGRPGLKGTDGEGAAELARRLGAVPVAPERARRALARLAPHLERITLLTGHGELGESVAAALDLRPQLIGAPAREATTAQDSRELAAAMLSSGVDLILFAGGDGTARDIFDVAGGAIPMLGVPTGVKMHSAVFATGAENAGDVTARFLARSAGQPRLREAEIMDIDEGELRAGRLSARLHGYAQVPYERLLVQHAKAGPARDDDAALDALCRKLAQSMEAGCLYVFGPGTTTQRILRHAGIEGTLLGVDAVADGKLLGADLGERAILELSEGRSLRILVGVVGGQGFVFGRGNQQISAEVIKCAGRDGITIVASLAKILALEEQSLFVDSGDEALDSALAGFIRVETGPGQVLMCRLRAA